MVVEDDPNDAYLICREIKKFVPQYHISHMADGLEAKEHLKSGHVPLFIVTDIQMPRMDGLELIAWIREEAHLRNVPIAILSGSEDPHHQEQCDDLQVKRILKKGSSMTELRELICRFSEQAICEVGIP